MSPTKKPKEKPPREKNVPRMQEGRHQSKEASHEPCQKGSHKGRVGSFNPEHRNQQRKKARACTLNINKQARAERLEVEIVPCKGLPKGHASTKKSPFQIPQYQSWLFNGEVSLYGKGAQRKG